ncbi:MAG: response regulator [Anaerolineales bacterium]|nr:response regulator [Anaerolineales bacterium]MCB9146495.1 response regulator [Anaerolineales bacterium]
MPERILIVDDDVDTLRLVGLMLQRQGYQVIAASNGSQGLTKAFEERPNLILLDVMMPDMDGYEVTRRLRSNPATASIPILMFTAKTQLDDKVTGFEAGADDYLTKPTHPTELQTHIRALLSRVSTAAKTPEELETVIKEKHGYVIGVSSARSGAGVSTFASNLAAALYARDKADVIVAELTPGQGTLALDLGLEENTKLSELLKSTPVEVTREKVLSSLVTHASGMRLLLASDNPLDMDLAARTENFNALVLRLATLARFVILDFGAGLPHSVQKMLPLCAERIVVLEGTVNSIHYTRQLLSAFEELKLEKKSVSVVVNNRIRSDMQIPWVQVQEKLGHSILSTIIPSPELFMQALRLQTPAILAQPENMISQQFLKIADAILEREKNNK